MSLDDDNRCSVCDGAGQRRVPRGLTPAGATIPHFTECAACGGRGKR